MSDVAFRILGPLEIAGVAASELISAVKPRQVLATLLLHPNRFVSTELITDALWEGRPPRSGAANLRTYIRMLRECLDHAGVRSRVDTHAAGYRLAVSPDDLDLSYSELLAAEGRHLVASGDGPGGLALLDRACRLWRGTPLEDLPLCSTWQDSLSRLEHQHATLVDEVIPLHLRYGDPQHAVDLARNALARDPYSEDLWYHVVSCLKKSGQIGAAQRAVRECHELLARDLGTEPGPRFMAMAASLADEPAEETAGSPGERQAVHIGPVPRPYVPRQLPPDIPDFTGRTRQLAYLTDIVCSRLDDRPPVAVISGPPGAGKSALAVRAAHAVRDHFPDGQLFLDLRGGTQPRGSAEALGEMLLGLGVPETAIPDDADRRAAALRSELASRRVLMVLDDAVSAAQVAPLLPGTGTSAMLVTTRRSLAELTGALHIELEVMETGEAHQLLAGIVGAQRATADEAAAEEILDACGRLPLAIRVAATRLVQRPDLTLRGLARRLRDSAHVLDELSGGAGGVRASAELSYRMLSVEQARGYHLLGLLGTGNSPTWIFQALADPTTADRMIDGLADAHLVQLASDPATGRAVMRIHDLLRLHARELAARFDRAHSDLRLVAREWIARTHRATDALPFRYFGVALPEAPTPSHLDDPIGAGWLAAERHGLLPTLRTAVEHGMLEDAWRLAAGWSPYLDLRGDYSLWTEALQAVLPALDGPDHPLGRAVLLRDLGQVAIYRDQLALAHERLAASLELFEGLEHRGGAGVAHIGLGTVQRVRDCDDAAMEHYLAALDAFEAVGDRAGEAVARNAIAFVWLRRGRLDEAEPWLQRAFDLAGEAGDAHRQAQVRRRFAVLRQEQGQLAAAQSELDAALQTFESLGDQHCASYARTALGELCLHQGDLARAQRLFIDALSVGRELEDITTQAQAYGRLGEVSLRAGRTVAARRYLALAVRSWQLGSNPAQARRAQQVLDRIGAGPPDTDDS
ncbi:MAG TPA: BTAD domain-containing putative transcriptional regulator [Candidatus Limnocylindrales bacterium]